MTALSASGVSCSTGRLAPGDWLEVGAIALYLEKVSTEDTQVAISLEEPSEVVWGSVSMTPPRRRSA